MFKALFKKYVPTKEELEKDIDVLVLMLNGDENHDKGIHARIQFNIDYVVKNYGGF